MKVIVYTNTGEEEFHNVEEEGLQETDNFLVITHETAIRMIPISKIEDVEIVGDDE